MNTMANAKREKEKALTQFVSSVSDTEAYECKRFVAEASIRSVEWTNEWTIIHV